MELPESLEIIGDYAFADYDNITIDMSKLINLKSVGTGAFENCNVRFIYIPKEVKTLDDLYTSYDEDNYENEFIIYFFEVSKEEYESGGYLYDINTIYDEETGEYEKVDCNIVYWGVSNENLFVYDNVVYLLKDDNTAIAASVCLDSRIEYYFEDEDYEMEIDVNIHETIDVNGNIYTVTEVGDGFAHRVQYIDFITLPDTITKIGKNAFNSDEIRGGINLPLSVTYIGEYAFYRYDPECDVIFPLSSNVEYIGLNAFDDDDYNIDIYVSNTKEEIQESCSWYDDMFDNVKIIFDIIHGIDYAIIDNFYIKLRYNNTATIERYLGDDDVQFVTIPSSFEAYGKTYIVDTIANNAFDFDSYDEYFYESMIVYVPDTIKYVYSDSFDHEGGLIVFEGEKPVQLDLFKESEDDSFDYGDYFDFEMTILYNNPELIFVDKYILQELDDGTYKIVKYMYNDIDDECEVIDYLGVPAIINSNNESYQISTIGSYAYSLIDEGVDIIVIDDGIKIIEDYAFYGANELYVENFVMVPSSVEYIGKFAFADIGIYDDDFFLMKNDVPSNWHVYWNAENLDEDDDEDDYVYLFEPICLDAFEFIYIDYDWYGYRLFYRIEDDLAYIVKAIVINKDRFTGQIILPEKIEFNGKKISVVGVDEYSLEIFGEVYLKKNIVYIEENCVEVRDYGENRCSTKFYYELDVFPINWWDALYDFVEYNWDPDGGYIRKDNQE